MSEEYPEEQELETEEPVSEEPVEPEPAAPAPEPVPPRDPTQDDDPTYRVEAWSGLTRYVCLICQHEDWSVETLEQHMAVYHRGVMREAPADAAGDEALAAPDDIPETVAASDAEPEERV